MTKSKLLEMHNVGIVVASLDNAISFFMEIGLKMEERAKANVCIRFASGYCLWLF
jgi:hypothetical protein